MERGIKHVVKCRCILPQFKNLPDPPVHQFVVFSILDEETDTIAIKFVQCENCGLVHKVTDVCTSEILMNRENLNSIMSLEDVKSGMPESLVAILDKHQVDRATYELASWTLANERWGTNIMLNADLIDGMKQGKFVSILGSTIFRVDVFSRSEIVK